MRAGVLVVKSDSSIVVQYVNVNVPIKCVLYELADVLFAADVGAVKCRIPTSALGFAARAPLHSRRPYR
jgi:hypothetical protein